MHAVFRELLPATAVEHVAFANLTGKDGRNVAVARRTGLDVFSIVPSAVRP